MLAHLPYTQIAFVIHVFVCVYFLIYVHRYLAPLKNAKKQLKEDSNLLVKKNKSFNVLDLVMVNNATTKNKDVFGFIADMCNEEVIHGQIFYLVRLNWEGSRYIVVSEKHLQKEALREDLLLFMRQYNSVVDFEKVITEYKLYNRLNSKLITLLRFLHFKGNTQFIFDLLSYIRPSDYENKQYELPQEGRERLRHIINYQYFLQVGNTLKAKQTKGRATE